MSSFQGNEFEEMLNELVLKCATKFNFKANYRAFCKEIGKSPTSPSQWKRYNRISPNNQQLIHEKFGVNFNYMNGNSPIIFIDDEVKLPSTPTGNLLERIERLEEMIAVTSSERTEKYKMLRNNLKNAPVLLQEIKDFAEEIDDKKAKTRLLDLINKLEQVL